MTPLLDLASPHSELIRFRKALRSLYILSTEVLPSPARTSYEVSEHTDPTPPLSPLTPSLLLSLSPPTPLPVPREGGRAQQFAVSGAGERFRGNGYISTVSRDRRPADPPAFLSSSLQPDTLYVITWTCCGWGARNGQLGGKGN